MNTHIRLNIDCDLSPIKNATSPSVNFVDNVDCNRLRNNSVADGGYGAQVAFDATKFVVKRLEDGEIVHYAPGRDLEIEDWKSGDAIPTMAIILLDELGQGPASRRAKVDQANDKDYFPQSNTKAEFNLAEYAENVNIIVEPLDQLLDSKLMFDVVNGTGNIAIGRPFQKPGNYSLAVWMANENQNNMTIHVTIRECIINEEPSLNRTVCRECDSNQYNVLSSEFRCELCPENANCSSPFILPENGYWNAFPCSNQIQRCFSTKACKGMNWTEFLNYLGFKPVDCMFNASTLGWYERNLCQEGYSGPLCGSCTESSGRSGPYDCRRCFSDFVSVLMIFASIVILTWLVVCQIKGNLYLNPSQYLTSKKKSRILTTISCSLRRTTITNFTEADSETQNVNQEQIHAYRREEKKRKQKIVELIKAKYNPLLLMHLSTCFIDHNQFLSNHGRWYFPQYLLECVHEKPSSDMG